MFSLSLPGLCRFLPRTCLLLVCLSMAATAAPVDSPSTNDILAQYQNKVMMLRHFYCGKELKFDVHGATTSRAFTGCVDLMPRRQD